MSFFQSLRVITFYECDQFNKISGVFKKYHDFGMRSAVYFADLFNIKISEQLKLELNKHKNKVNKIRLLSEKALSHLRDFSVLCLNAVYLFTL